MIKGSRGLIDGGSSLTPICNRFGDHKFSGSASKSILLFKQPLCIQLKLFDPSASIVNTYRKQDLLQVTKGVEWMYFNIFGGKMFCFSGSFIFFK